MNKMTRFILGCFIGLVCNNAFAVMRFPLNIDTYTLESSTRVSRTEFIYTYRASLTNTGVAVRNAAATLRLTAPGVTVLDGTLSFGDVPESSTAVSTDTFSLRYDRTYTFSAADLHWSITYDPAPIITLPAAPSLTLGFGIKQLQFAWTGVSGATSYRLMQNPDGVAGYAQVGADIPSDVTATALDIAVFKHDWANARYLLEACNISGCTVSNEVNTIGSVLSAIGYLKASNTGAGDWFGYSVALSNDGNTLAVGAPNEDSSSPGVNGAPDELAPNAGAVYVYTHTASGWSQQAYLKASNIGTGDLFGSSVALSGDGYTLAVGALGEDSNSTGINSTPDELALNSGAVYVFGRSADSWSQQAYLKAPQYSGVVNGKFGTSVALNDDGHTLAVGEPIAPFPAAIRTGKTHVYTRDAGSWSYQSYLGASFSNEYDGFGSSVALSGDGNTLAVGAPFKSRSIGGYSDNSGAAYIFVRTGNLWSRPAQVMGSKVISDDFFGVSVALSRDGNTLAVGSLSEWGNHCSPPTYVCSYVGGAVYVFARGVGSWSEQAYLIRKQDPGDSHIGYDIALNGDGNTLVIGAQLQVKGLSGSLHFEERAYIYGRSAGAWSEQTFVSSADAGFLFWKQYTWPPSRFPVSMALSGDGNTLAIGAMSEMSSTTGIGSTPNKLAPQAGAVYLY